MIEQVKINTIITEGLRRACGCEIVKSNTTAKMPPYPYISFTILTTENQKGTYSGQDVKAIPAKQTWSFTVQGDRDDEALETAMRARDWLEENGRLHLNDRGIIVQSIGAITSRDNMLTIEYEYRKGFDMVLSLVNVVEMPETETIEQVNIEEEINDGKE